MRKTMMEKLFSTSDLSLAATISLQYPIESLDKTNPRRVLFIFKNSKQIEKLVDSYQRNELEVEPLSFFNQLKNIKSRIYE